jgi:hypothetical protein
MSADSPGWAKESIKAITPDGSRKSMIKLGRSRGNGDGLTQRVGNVQYLISLAYLGLKSWNPYSSRELESGFFKNKEF